MLTLRPGGINRMCAATIVFCTLALSTNAQGTNTQQNEEGQLLLGLILQDDADKVERYLSSKSIPQLSNISLLKTAIIRGNKRIVEAFLKAGANTGEAGLICAAVSNVSMTELLIAQGVSIHGKECDGMSPLQRAVKGGYKETVQILLKSGAEATDKSVEINTSSSSLRDAAMAGNVPIMKMLLEKGGTLNSKDIKEVTQRNCMAGNLEALKLLKDKGITPNYDQCYLYLSWIEKPYPDLLAWLQSQSKITKFEIDGQPLINAAAERGNMLMAKFLIQAGSKLDLLDAHYKYSALGAALSPEQVSRPLRLEMAELLLKHGADPNVRNEKKGMTLLEELSDTSFCNDPDIHHPFWTKRAESAELLIKYGADVNSKNPQGGYTALHFAARSANALMVKVLLDHGADVNATTADGATPLYWMVGGYEGCAAIERETMTIQALVAHGADMDREVHGKKLTELVDKKRRGSGELLKTLERLYADRQKQAKAGQAH